MPYSDRGIYSQATIHPALLAALPDEARQAWDEVQHVHERLTTAKGELVALTRQAEEAEQRDRDAADHAVRAGKPVPDATVPKAQKALDAKKREIPALERLAADRERDFDRRLATHRDALTVRMERQAEKSVREALDALDRLTTAMESAALYVGLWSWLRAGMAGRPSRRTVSVNVGGTQHAATALTGWVRTAVASEAPSAVHEREAERERQREMQQHGRTADGLVMDRAAL